jgi:hypothetical protein
MRGYSKVENVLAMKLDIIVWADDDLFMAVALSDEAAVALGKMLAPDDTIRAGCCPLNNLHPHEFLSHIPATLMVHFYDRKENTLKNLRDKKQSLQ